MEPYILPPPAYEEVFFLRIFIFANGLLTSLQDKIILQPEDIIIAADGGARHCKNLGIRPHFIIGDFDSLNQAELDEVGKPGTKLIKHPARKDFTDLELALDYACQLGGEEILVYGGLGLRWDQTLANLLLLGKYQNSTAPMRLVDGKQEISLLDPARPWIIQGTPGDIVSLIPVAGNAEGITTQGLEYPLTDEILYFGSTRGISNVLLGERASVELKKGILICVLIHNQTTSSVG